MTNPIYTPEPSVDPAYAANQLDFLTAPTGAVLGAAAEEAWRFNPSPTIYRWLERQAELGGPAGRYLPRQEPPALMDSEAANARYGIEGQLHFDGPVPEATAADLRQLKLDELRRRDLFARRRGGFLETAAMFGVGLGVSALDPLNIASAFIPAIGPERAAALIARATSPLGRAATRAGIGAVEGGVGALMLEPIIAAGAVSEQADYTAADSFLNVAFGIGLGAGLHVGAGALGDYFRREPAAATPTLPARGAGETPGNRERFAAAPILEKRELLGGAVAEMVEGGRVERTGPAAALRPPRVPIAAADPKDVAGSLARFAGEIEAGGTAAARPGSARALDAGAIDEALAKRIAEALPTVDVTGYRLIFQSDEIRHALARHGIDARTLGAGERPITAADIGRAPAIMATADEIRPAGETHQGLPVLQFRKREADGTSVVVEEVRARRRRLQFKTMYRLGRDGEGGGPGTTNAPTAEAEGPLSLRPNRGPGAAEGNIGVAPRPDNPDAAIAEAAEAAVKESETRQADPEKALAEEVAALEDELARLDPAKLLAYARDPEAGPLDPKRLAGLMGAEPEAVRRALDHLAATTRAVKKTAAGKYRRPAKEGPLDLLQRIAKEGGLKPDGDLAAMDAQRFIPRYGALIRKTGASLDDMARHLAELGYFPELPAGERPTPRQLLEKLDAALRGTKFYALADDAEVAAREAERQQAEFKARAEDMGREVVELAKAMGETIGEAEARAIGERAVADGMDAETALMDHVERLAIEAADAIRAETGRAELGEEIPFEDIAPREDGDAPRAGEPEPEAQQADEAQGAAGGAAAAETGRFRPAIDQGLLSPSGRVSKRARAAALERVRVELFGTEGLQRPTGPEVPLVDRLRREAEELRGLAERGMGVRKHAKRAAELEAQIAELEAKARGDFTERTDQGEQLVAGVLTVPVTDRARAELGMGARLKPAAEQKGTRGFGLFGGEPESDLPDTVDMLTGDLLARTDPAVARADAAESEAQETGDAIEASADCLTRRGG